MKEEFWQERWRENQTAWHEAAPHEYLTQHIELLGLKEGDTVFLPLCGKTLDIDWLLGKGFRVVGVEFNRPAIEEVFGRLGLTPTISRHGVLTDFQAGKLRLFHGDFFALNSAILGEVHGVFDRGSLVALPDETRALYVKHLPTITGKAPQIAVCYDYEQSQTQGPPFSIPFSSVKALYDGQYLCKQIECRPIGEPLVQRCVGDELAVLLKAQ